ncbi:hypothetical protein MKW98_002957 [Papaver atlanticum]|uniref:Leucine-rich repeat-containing N-terminal plant-type domain-containing protein n=1 Tax=Papaver atlanticum TaxID=357466 RepID=A0AAD4XZI2_9MAGN|nr:hypothetical protein MKW98_002957 [Papaver atlanticum]
MDMKLLPQRHNSFNFMSSILLLVCSLTFIISYMCMDVNCLVTINGDNESNDRVALLAFKNEITQDPPGILSSWDNSNSSLHFCEWGGVTCSRRHPSRVTGLYLNSQRLVGSISPHIGNLSFLKILNLNNNSLNGEIPQQMGRLSRLQGLDLSNNSLEGEIPHNISGCSNLRYLYIVNNLLMGRIPNEIGFYLPRLAFLSLRGNKLSGHIPASLGNLSSSLVQLYLDYNNLEGRIPGTLSQLTKLKLLALESNRLSGFQNLVGLATLFLDSNLLTGSIPTGIGNLQNLGILHLRFNKLSGIIPSSFGNLTKLFELDLRHNKLTGLVPSSLGYCEFLQKLFLGNNRLSGSIPEQVFELPSLSGVLGLSNNSLTGSLPVEVERIEEITDSRLLLDVEGEHHSGSTRDTRRQIMSRIIQIGVKCSSELPTDRSCMNEVSVDLQALKDQLQGVEM